MTFMPSLEELNLSQNPFAQANLSNIQFSSGAINFANGGSTIENTPSPNDLTSTVPAAYTYFQQPNAGSNMMFALAAGGIVLAVLLLRRKK